MCLANAESIFSSSNSHYRNLESKFELSAFEYIKKLNMIRFSLFIIMFCVSYDIEAEEGDKNAILH